MRGFKQDEITVFKDQMSFILSIVLLLLNGVMFVETKSVIEITDNFNTTSTTSSDTWDIATDNPAVYDIIPFLDLESLFEDATQMNDEAISRVRRGSSKYRKRVFKKVSPVQTQNRPFSATVRVSNTCTGTLISPRHVLTAAHCVHNHKRPKFKLPLLKIGFLQRNGKFHWIKVTKMFVPRGWKNIRNGKHKSSEHSILDFDFAVLRLKRSHGRPYLKTEKGRYHVDSRMMFNGFPASMTTGNNMWHSACQIPRIHSNKNIIFSTCTGSPGISGSGLYQIHNKASGYAVTGVVSALLQFKNKGRQISWTVATKLDLDKLNQICEWTRLKWLCE